MKFIQFITKGVFLLALVLVSCRNNGGSNENTPNEPTLTGGDKDAHGCIASAGYTWSGVQNRCIRLWEDGIKLEPLEQPVQADTAAMNVFLVFSADSLKAELFDIRLKEPLVLSLTDKAAGVYSSGSYQAKRMNGKWAVQNNGETESVEL
jgi:hypothetical protein